ncbi:hypothetical protein Tco_0204727 [Tanacetum coccineum]
MTCSSNESKTSHAVAANLSKLELKKILIDKMESNKSIHRSDEQKNLYKALVDAYESDKLILDTYGDAVSFKGQSTSAPKEKTSKTIGKSTEGSKSPHKSAGESAQAEELMHTAKDLEELAHQEFETGKPAKPPTPNHDWNKTFPNAHGPVQPWLSSLAQIEDSSELFNELMDTPLDFSTFMMNRLKVDTLTPELLASLTLELMKGSCKSLGRKRQQFYGFAANRESARDIYSKHRIIAITKLRIVEWHNYKHLDWILIRRDNDKLYKFKEGDFNRLRIQDIEDISIVIQRRVEDLQLGVESYQKKLNLTKPDTYRSDLKQREAYTTYSNPTERFYTSVGNPVKEILLKLNLPDHRSILTDSKVTPTKHGRMTKPYSSSGFIANCFNTRYLTMKVKVPDSS